MSQDEKLDYSKNAPQTAAERRDNNVQRFKKSRFRRICATIYGKTRAEIQILAEDPAFSYAVVGNETCPETKRQHWQCYFEFKKQTGWNNVKRILGDTAHFERCKGNGAQNRKYCVKDGDFIEEGQLKNPGKRNDLQELRDAVESGMSYFRILQTCDAAAKHPKFFECYRQEWKKQQLGRLTLTLRPWQETLTGILTTEPADPRKILWYWDQTGNTGKTTLAKYLVRNHGAWYGTSGKHSDLAFAYNGEPICIFDFARTTADRVPYSILEQIKNGMLFSQKYTSVTKQFDIPHLVVFANFPPAKHDEHGILTMSLDRWDVNEVVVPASGCKSRKRKRVKVEEEKKKKTACGKCNCTCIEETGDRCLCCQCKREIEQHFIDLTADSDVEEIEVIEETDLSDLSDFANGEDSDFFP